MDGESVKVKEYLKYISRHIAFLKRLNNGISSNEYRWYCALRESIKQWGKAHVVFYGYLRGEITGEQAKSICGVSERTFYRTMSRQRESLIKFIEEQEKALSEKYPFIPMSNFTTNYIKRR